MSTMLLKKITKETLVLLTRSDADRRFEELAFVLAASFVYLAGPDSWTRHCSEKEDPKKKRLFEDMNNTSADKRRGWNGWNTRPICGSV